MKGGSNPAVARAMTARFQKAQRLWRRVRNNFALEIGAREPIPLVVGGVQRGVIRAWFRADTTKPAVPRAGTLLKVLNTLGIDDTPFREYLAHLQPGKTLVQAFCPKCQNRWSSSRSSLDRAERRRARQGLRPMRRRPDGAVEWLCARCVRGEIGRANFLLINRPGRTRGRDRRPRRASFKTEQHRKGIGAGHIALARLTKPFRLCLLCQLVRYDRQWHQLCWLAWRWYCWRRDLDPAMMRPPRVRRRGPDPARRLKRNYELLVRKVVGEESPQQLFSDTRISLKAVPAGRRGRPRRLRSDSSIITKAAKAFLRQAPGDWSLIFPRKDWHTTLREEALPLPSSLRDFVETGGRDWLIIRLHSFEMRPDNIAQVTGASADHVRLLIATMDSVPAGKTDQP